MVVNIPDLKEEIQKCIPNVVKSVAEETVKTKKFQKPWSDLFKKTQADFKEEAGKTLNETLKTVLNKNQEEIVSKTLSKQDQHQFEKDRKARDVIISNIPESKSAEPLDRINEDKDWVTRICDIDKTQIIKCYRVGSSHSETGKHRLLLVTVDRPELARELHNYGDGLRVFMADKVYWINPDLIRAERVANYKARQERKRRRDDAMSAQMNRNTEIRKLTTMNSVKEASEHSSSSEHTINKMPKENSEQIHVDAEKKSEDKSKDDSGNFQEKNEEGI